MGWLVLGLAALPLAAVAYVAFDWLLPRILEPVPEPTAAAHALGPPDGSRRGRFSLSGHHVTALRVAAAAAVVVVIILVASRRPSSVRGPAAVPGSAPAGQVQLPPPIPLQVLLRFGTDGSGPGQFHDPRDVAVDLAGDVYVADTGNKRVVKVRADGTPSAVWASSAKGAFVEPSSLGTVKDGVIVDDSEAAQLHKFDFNGQPIAGFEHDLGLSHPRGIGVAPDGTIYVGDTANSRILKVGADGSPQGPFDTKGVKLEQPTGVVVDEQGSVYSVEPTASRIQKFSADGALQASFYLPTAVTVYPARAQWILGRGLVVSLPEENELLTYGPAGAVQATFVPQPDAANPAPRRAIGLAPSPDRASVLVVWNTASAVTQLAWPS